MSYLIVRRLKNFNNQLKNKNNLWKFYDCKKSQLNLNFEEDNIFHYIVFHSKFIIQSKYPKRSDYGSSNQCNNKFNEDRFNWILDIEFIINTFY